MEEEALRGGVVSAYGRVWRRCARLCVHSSRASIHNHVLWHFDICCVWTTYCDAVILLAGFYQKSYIYPYRGSQHTEQHDDNMSHLSALCLLLHQHTSMCYQGIRCKAMAARLRHWHSLFSIVFFYVGKWKGRIRWVVVSETCGAKVKKSNKICYLRLVSVDFNETNTNFKAIKEF